MLSWYFIAKKHQTIQYTWCIDRHLFTKCDKLGLFRHPCPTIMFIAFQYNCSSSHKQYDSLCKITHTKMKKKCLVIQFAFNYQICIFLFENDFHYLKLLSWNKNTIAILMATVEKRASNSSYKFWINSAFLILFNVLREIHLKLLRNIEIITNST